MWNIVFYVDHRGKCPPREFMEELPVMEQAKIRNVLRLLQEFVILHGYRKQSQKAPDREIEIAMRRMQELMDEV